MALSVQHRVLSDLTAFLVLETERDYARYGIDRSKPAPLLAVAATGEVQAGKRGDPAAALAELKAPPPAVKAEPRYANQPAAAGAPTGGGRKSVAGSFKGSSGTKLFAEAESGESGDVVARGGVKLAGNPSAGGSVERLGRPTSNDSKKVDAKIEATVTVRVQSETSGAGADQFDVAKVISRKNSAVQRCYERALRDNPDEIRKVKVSFTVGTEGTITEVEVSSGLSADFAACIKSRFVTVRGLPILASPQKFTQSYVFTSDVGGVAETDQARRARVESERARQRQAELERQAAAELAVQACTVDLRWRHANPEAAKARDLADQSTPESEQPPETERESPQQRRERAQEEEQERRESAKVRRQDRAEQRKEDRREDQANSHYLTALRVMRAHDAAVKACLQRAQSALDGEVVTTVELTVVDGKPDLPTPAPTEADADPLTVCLDGVLRGLRGLPKVNDLLDVQLAYRLRGDQFEAYPSPVAIAKRIARERAGRDRKRPIKSIFHEFGGAGCELGSVGVDPEQALAESREPNTENLPDPIALRYWKLHSQKGQADAGRAAWQWHLQAPGEVLPLVLYGQAIVARDPRQAARAFGSLIDLHPARADLRRFAGNLLETCGAAGQATALDTYAAAVKLRPDHVSGYPQQVWALARAGHYDLALGQLEAGLVAERRSDASQLAPEVARDSMGLIAAAWLASDPTEITALSLRLCRAEATLPTGPALRFLLTWETDANDVDFHVRDGKGDQSCYNNPELASGGWLFEDVTTGYGPEWYAIDEPKAYPYSLFAHYYARGPMGFGMGRVLVVRWDGKRLAFEHKPFVVTADDQAVAIGAVR